jgi:hypothetical protein
MKMIYLFRRCFFLALIFCFSSNVEAEDRFFNLNIKDGRIAQAERLMRVKKGDQITWRVQSDTEGELHMHAYQIDLTVTPGVRKVHIFKAFASGRFRVEWHSEGEQGKGIHHKDSFALLEVFPE